MSGINFASNPLASNTARYLESYQKAVNSSIEKLSSGKKFNSASDSPGETGYINRFRAAIVSNKQLTDNLQDNISMLQTADYAITGSGGISSILTTIREKVVQADNSSLTSADKADLQQEIEDLIDEIDDIATGTEFNTKKLLNGELGAKLTSSNSGLAGYATDFIDSNSYHFTDIAGATKHEYRAGNAPAATTDITGSDYDYSKTLGTTGAFTLDGTNSDAAGDYEVVFTSSTEFNVYNNSTGVLTASGTAGSQFTLNSMGITIGSDGTYAEGYKYNFSTSNGANTLSNLEEGNRGLSANTSLTASEWGSDSMMNSYFDIKFQFDSGSLKYAAYDPDGNRMGSWVDSGSQFEAYESSKLNGSTFTFTSADAGLGDTWHVQFANYDSLQSAGGTVSIGNADASFSVSYTGEDRLSDVVSSINANGDGVATASLDTSSGSDILKLTASDHGEEARLSVSDSSGNFVTATGLSETSGTGTDATLKYNGQEQKSSSGYFYDIADDVVFEVANDAEIDSGYVSVSDTSVTQATNVNGPNGVSIFVRDLTAGGLGLVRADGSYDIDVTSPSGVSDGLTLVDTALTTVGSAASKIGSIVNNLDSHTSFVSNMVSEYEANLSQHEDTDFAEETAAFYAASAGRDTAAAMTAQANLQPARVLQLLGLITNS